MKRSQIAKLLNCYIARSKKSNTTIQQYNNTKPQIGFTLIELLVAISIIGILSSFLLANFIGVRQRARDGVRKSDLRQIQSALELYRSDRGAYPTSPLPRCGLPLQDSSSPPVIYMKKIPCDPSTGAIYAYSSPSGNAAYSIMACLENGNDFQIDKDTSTPPKPIRCNGGATETTDTTWQYTLQNP